MFNKRVDTCANRLSRALTIRGMRQSELCQITKIPKSSMSQYLGGEYEPKQDRIYLIARALDVSEAWLMGYDVPMKRTKSLDDYEDNPHELELHDYFETLNTEKQIGIVEYVKAVSEGKKDVPSPKEPTLTEGEKMVLELFRKIPEDRQAEALDLLRVALRMQKKL